MTSPTDRLNVSFERRAFIVGATAAAAGLALAPAFALAAGRRSAAAYFGWTELRDGVFATTTFETGGNCLVAAGDEGALLVDTKFPAFVRQLARDAEELTGRPLAQVVNTHHHADHTGGNLEFTGRLPVLAHENAVERVKGQHDRHRQGVLGGRRQIASLPEDDREAALADLSHFLGGIEGYDADSWAPSRPLPTGTTGLDVGGRWVELIHQGRPAHTDNDLVVWLPESNILHTGDLVFNGLFPFFDPDGGANARGWIETLRLLAERCDEDTIVVPGHGPLGGVEIIHAQMRYIEDLWEAVEKEIDAGHPLDEVRTRVWPFMDGLGYEAIRERGVVFVYNEIVSSR